MPSSYLGGYGEDTETMGRSEKGGRERNETVTELLAALETELEDEKPWACLASVWSRRFSGNHAGSLDARIGARK